MKYYSLLLCFLLLLSCGAGRNRSLNELTIAPVIIEQEDQVVADRLDLLKDIGFNSVLFIGTKPNMWKELAVQAQGRDMYALFMVDISDTDLIKDFILENGTTGKIDGLWLRQGEIFSKKDLSELQGALQEMKKSISDRHVLGQLFVQSNTGDMVSLLKNGKLVRGVVYFDHSAAGLLGVATQIGTEENPSTGIGANIAKMYNWRNFYTKSSDLIVPLANNFSYAFAQAKIFPLITAVMTSVSGPLYFPVALSATDRFFYQQDISLIKKYLDLRKAHPSLYKGRHSNLSYSNGVYTDMKESKSERIILVCNFNAQALQYRLPYLDKFRLKGKRIRSLITGHSTLLTSNDLSFSLVPYQVDFWLIE